MKKMIRWAVCVFLRGLLLSLGLIGCGDASLFSGDVPLVEPMDVGAASSQGAVEPLLESLPTATTRGSLRIASIFPSLGRYAISGRQSHNGARLAIEKINHEGSGVHGRELELLEYRTGSYFIDAQNAAECVVDVDEVLAIVGSNSSGLSKVIAEIVDPLGLLQVSNVSTAPDLTWDPDSGRNREFVFRVCHSDAVMGGLLAEFARSELEARRVAVLYEVGRPYSAKLAASFLDHFNDAERGFGRDQGYVTERFAYKRRETDFRPHLQKIVAFGADTIFIPGSFSDATLIAMQADRLEIEATLLGGDSWSNRLLFARGGPRKTAYHSDHWYPRGEIKREYEARFGEVLNGARAALAYDAVCALAKALTAIGPLADADLLPGEGIARTRRRLRDVFAKVDFTGVTGRIRFDERGDAIKGCAIIEVAPCVDGYVSRQSTWLGER